MEKIGIFGGSFNPIHKGHTALAEQARVRLGLDKVLLIPASCSPFKQEEEMLSGEDRLELCRLAVADFPGLEVSDIEIKRGGVSYTYQTLETIAEPNKELYLIVGGDMFLSIGSWKNAMWISQTTTVCAAPRTAEQLPVLQKYAEQLEGWGYRVIVLDIPVMDVSSTSLRNKIRAGEDTSLWLDDKVAKRISEKRLYQ